MNLLILYIYIKPWFYGDPLAHLGILARSECLEPIHSSLPSIEDSPLMLVVYRCVDELHNGHWRVNQSNSQLFLKWKDGEIRLNPQFLDVWWCLDGSPCLNMHSRINISNSDGYHLTCLSWLFNQIQSHLWC